MITISQVQTTDRNTNQMQQNIINAVVPVFNDFVGTFSGQLLGCVENISTQIDYQTGTTQNTVSLSFPGSAGTSNATNLAITGLPAALYPQKNQTVFVRVVDNGTASVGLLVIGTDGYLAFYKDVLGSSFTNTGLKGVTSFTVTYIRNI